MSGFTSTSSSQYTANKFANYHSPEEGVKHIIKYNIPPGHGLSIAGISKLHENEVLLHHGTKLKYSHTTVHKNGYGVGDTHVHHVDVLPGHKKLEEYGEYSE